MTPDELADIGRALYGERWQTALAADLGVADRTMRRWVSEESAIPLGIVRDVRALLVARLQEIGGMIGFAVNPRERMIVHYPTAAYFRFDDEGRLTLMNANMIDRDKVMLITRGAEEALRQEMERDPSIKALWLDRAGRPTRKVFGITEKIRLGGYLTTILDEFNKSPPNGQSFMLYTKTARGLEPERYFVHVIRGNTSEEFDISKEDFERLRNMNVKVGSRSGHPLD